VFFTDVGFGLSQVLPVIVQSLISKKKNILIEQPEYHLHPRLQAELGDMFIEAALGERRNTFLIETHSEHLILRILRRIRETAEGTLPADLPPIKPDDVSVVYVQPGDAGSRIIPLPVNEEGEFTEPWPEGFFTERAKELF
jgi:predicted ATPase